jgi:hypothetical protein
VHEVGAKRNWDAVIWLGDFNSRSEGVGSEMKGALAQIGSRASIIEMLKKD